MSDIDTPKIVVRGPEKSFGSKRVLDGVDIDCGVGESLVIIGGSGTGKVGLRQMHPRAFAPRGRLDPIDGEETVGMRGRRATELMPSSACCFRAAPCSIRCASGRMSPSA
jgi:phospholipid/cholesterol/gamma-HCH transport system ATP-binding protein